MNELETSKVARYVSIIGAAFLLYRTVVALLSILIFLPFVLVLVAPSFWVFVVLGAVTYVSCSLVFILVEDSSLRLVAGIVAVMSSIVFVDPIAVTGAIIGVVGCALTFKARSAIELSLGCIVLYVGVVMTRLGIFSFAVELAVLFAGMLVLTVGTLDLRSNLEGDRNIISILALSIFWAVFVLADSSLHDQAIKESVLHSWQTVPWIFSVILITTLQVALGLSFIHDISK